MRSTLSTLVLVISILVLGCKSNELNGIYVCDKSLKKKDTTITHQGYNEITLDLTCMFTHFDFKGNSTVKIGTQGGDIVSSYVVDKNYVRIKGTGSDILLKVQDNGTLNGEGVAIGTYHKK